MVQTHMMDMEVRSRHWEKVFAVVQRSYSIDKHVDFFNWLQNSVSEVLPHDMLLASWGDFDITLERNKLSYDVASNLTNISTKLILDGSADIDQLMIYLHKTWLKNNRRWFVLNNLSQLDLDQKLNTNLLAGLKQLNSLLVYGVSDLRGSNECLYVFFSKQPVFEVKDSVMGLLMPHIDSVLRKIQHIEPIVMRADTSSCSGFLSALSDREMEIIHWVKSGKTNQEIGMILEISQNTVKSHLKRIFQKLNVTRRAQAVAILSN